jgi:hypothetical protein
MTLRVAVPDPVPGKSVLVQIVDFEMEAIGWQMRRRIGRHLSPGLVRRPGEAAVQEEQELI